MVRLGHSHNDPIDRQHVGVASNIEEFGDTRFSSTLPFTRATHLCGPKTLYGPHPHETQDHSPLTTSWLVVSTL